MTSKKDLERILGKEVIEEVSKAIKVYTNKWKDGLTDEEKLKSIDVIYNAIKMITYFHIRNIKEFYMKDKTKEEELILEEYEKICETIESNFIDKIPSFAEKDNILSVNEQFSKINDKINGSIERIYNFFTIEKYISERKNNPYETALENIRSNALEKEEYEFLTVINE